MSDSEDTAKDKGVSPPPLPADYGKPLTPVLESERLLSLDVLRGFALLGILVSNMFYFAQPLEQLGFRRGWWLGPGDLEADWISIFLVEGKFYPLFCFLFGLGFSIQMDRASSRGSDCKAKYRRRLFILMGLGLAHGIFLWDGDVLMAYAFCGFALLLFHNRKPLTLSIWAGALILLPAVLMLSLGLVIMVLSRNAELARMIQEVFAEDPQSSLELSKAYMIGSYADAVFHRIRELIITIPVILFYAPSFLGLFLLGCLAGRKRITTEMAQNHRFLIRILILSASVGLVGNFFGTWVMMSANMGEDLGLLFTGTAILSIFGPVLAVAYIAGIILLIAHKPSLSILHRSRRPDRWLLPTI
ncbi:MAG: DUF418 domain-containing protein [Blastochloris sp.]|nr:DUF418 domain-containing protein [Blastochloris sp.]